MNWIQTLHPYHLKQNLREVMTESGFIYSQSHMGGIDSLSWSLEALSNSRDLPKSLKRLLLSDLDQFTRRKDDTAYAHIANLLAINSFVDYLDTCIDHWSLLFFLVIISMCIHLSFSVGIMRKQLVGPHCCGNGDTSKVLVIGLKVPNRGLVSCCVCIYTT